MDFMVVGLIGRAERPDTGTGKLYVSQRLICTMGDSRHLYANAGPRRVKKGIAALNDVLINVLLFLFYTRDN